MKKIVSIVLGSLLFPLLVAVSCSEDNGGGTDVPDDTSKIELPADKLAEQNLRRAMQLVDAAIPAYFDSSKGMLMNEYYNPYTGAKTGIGGSDASVWKYTSSIEAVNAILKSLIAFKDAGQPALYNENFTRYSELLARLYDNAAYYKGTYTLVSFTQTKQWSVYAVPRGNEKGGANVGGDNNKYNVYDDQMWLIRELLDAYESTGNEEYFKDAEYLTGYVLDGWDCTLDSNGNENGGIPWGPGYVTKHACSNGPVISPLVWLHEIYKDKSDEVTYGYIDTDNKTRKTRTVKKSDYYLDFAEKVYEWQMNTLLRADGVFHDMRGGCTPSCDVAYETVDNVKYRKNTRLTRSEGTALTYNSGSMISGAADLYRATGLAPYLQNLKDMTTSSFSYFAKKDATVSGYYTYPLDSDWSNWFNGILFRGYMDAYNSYSGASECVESFQKNLDYAYSKFFYKGFLPVNLLVGWSRTDSNNKVNAMFTFAYASEYAMLARYELGKGN